MLTDAYFPRVNGVSTSIKTFRDDLRELGHHCLLVAPEYPQPCEAPDDIDIVRLPSRRVPLDPEDRLLQWRRLMGWAKLFSPGDFDVVHIQTPFTAHYAGLKIARRLGAPIVETYHTYFEHYLHHYIPAFPDSLTKAFARRLTLSQCGVADRVISPSPQMAAALRAYGVTTPIEILPTGLPESAFAKGERGRFRAQHGIPEERPVALFVGRIAHEKNIDFLLRMLIDLRKEVPDILMLIAGEGPAERHVQKLAATLGLQENVQFLGYMDRARTLPDCYRAADVFVFASRTETQGLVLLEAMAQGTPVISTAVMGTADVLKGMRGAIVAPEEEAAFAQLTARLLRDHDKRHSLSPLAERDALSWSSRAMTHRLVDIYEGVTSPKMPSRKEAA